MIEIRSLHTMDEMHAAYAVQQECWGADSETLVSPRTLFSYVNYGGHVLAAMDGEQIAGLLFGFLGTIIEESHRPAMANLLIASRQMVVRPAYRNQGIGYQLKLAQREIAQKQAVRLVMWTFDPLMARNAHLNVRRLGVVCRRYKPSYYAPDEDRLFAEWWITSRRVEERVNGSRSQLALSQYLETGAPVVNPTHATAEGFMPSSELTSPQGSFALVEIPTYYEQIAQESQAQAQRWRENVRRAFHMLTGEGFIVTDFLREQHEGRDRAFYLLSFDVGFDFNRS